MRLMERLGLEKRRYFTAEGDMATTEANVGASTWKGYKAKGTKKKGGKTVPNCVKEEEVVAEHHQKDKDGNTIPHEGEELEKARKVYTTTSMLRKEVVLLQSQAVRTILHLTHLSSKDC